MSSTVVLVVDGDDDYAAVRRVCTTTGFVTVHAKDTVDAVPLLERHCPDVVIMPRRLAVGDVLVFIAQLRDKLPNVLIIVLGPAQDLAVLDAGADILLGEPLEERALASALQPLLAVDPDKPSMMPLKLVIVEPDAYLGTVMLRWLRKAFDVSLVTSGWRALEEIRERRPDAILTELRLPDMDPSELHAAIDNAVSGLGARTLFMTSGFVADKPQQFLARIPGQWIEKPFDLARLRTALYALFG
jgi:DNA-binding response OmpR family regulator